MIRYTKVGKTLYYSINDIANYFREKECIGSRSAYKIPFMMRYSMNRSKKCHQGFDQTLAVTVFDEFYDWVVFGRIYSFLTKKEKEKVAASGVLDFIDMNNIDMAKGYYPKVANEFTECFLSISFNKTFE